MGINYFDSKNKEYKEGDIVFNPYFGDYWLVVKWSEEEIKNYDFQCPYGFIQYGDIDNYCMDIDEPRGFVIVYSIGDENYDEALKELNEISKKIKEELS